jgi:hypothetical protein
MAYATIAQLQERITTPLDGGDALARFTDALDEASGMINDDTGRNFATRAGIAKTFAVQDLNAYALKLPDFTAIVSLKVDDDDDGTFETTIAATGYELTGSSDDDGWPYDSIRLLDRDFPTCGRRVRRIEITADWGWSAVPAGIVKATTLLAARIGGREGSSATGLMSFGGEAGGAYIRTNDPDYRHAIRRYIRPMVA